MLENELLKYTYFGFERSQLMDVKLLALGSTWCLWGLSVG